MNVQQKYWMGKGGELGQRAGREEAIQKFKEACDLASGLASATDGALRLAEEAREEYGTESQQYEQAVHNFSSMVSDFVSAVNTEEALAIVLSTLWGCTVNKKTCSVNCPPHRPLPSYYDFPVVFESFEDLTTARRLVPEPNGPQGVPVPVPTPTEPWRGIPFPLPEEVVPIPSVPVPVPGPMIPPYIPSPLPTLPKEALPIPTPTPLPTPYKTGDQPWVEDITPFVPKDTTLLPSLPTTPGAGGFLPIITGLQGPFRPSGLVARKRRRRRK